MTGVQTCALPIWLVRFFELAHLAGELETVPELHFVQGVRTGA